MALDPAPEVVHEEAGVVAAVGSVMVTVLWLNRRAPDTDVTHVLGLNVAVTDRSALMVTVQVLAEPLQAPLQPVKLDPVPALAVSVTVLPVVNEALHVVPQLMPLGELVTVPAPMPARATVSVC